MPQGSSGVLYELQVAVFVAARRKLCDAFDVEGGFCAIGPAATIEMQKHSLELPDLVFMLRNAEVIEAGTLSNSGLWWRFSAESLDGHSGVGVAEVIGGSFIISMLEMQFPSPLACA